MRSLYVAAAAVAFAATPASAQDAAPTFSGAHIGVIAGVDSLHGGGDSETGVAFGITGGYDIRKNNAVFGLELEAADSTVSQSGVSASRDLYAGLRVGVVASDHALIYLKAGYTNARASFAGTGTNFDGFRAGAGVEWAIGQHLSIRGEYRYSNYQDGLSRNQGVIGLGYRF